MLLAIVDAAVAGDMWPDLLPLVELLPAAAQEIVRERAPEDLASR
ncbi:MAG: hypothetical protein ACRDKY_06980 [Solirubrobacteraceae bacterium]